MTDEWKPIYCERCYQLAPEECTCPDGPLGARSIIPINAGSPPDLGLARTSNPDGSIPKSRPLAVSRSPRVSSLRVKALTGAILLDALGEAFGRNDSRLHGDVMRAIESGLAVQT